MKKPQVKALKKLAENENGNFWTNLIKFLFSFYEVFINKSKSLKLA